MSDLQWFLVVSSPRTKAVVSSCERPQGAQDGVRGDPCVDLGGGDIDLPEGTDLRSPRPSSRMWSGLRATGTGSSLRLHGENGDEVRLDFPSLAHPTKEQNLLVFAPGDAAAFPEAGCIKRADATDDDGHTYVEPAHGDLEIPRARGVAASRRLLPGGWFHRMFRVSVAGERGTVVVFSDDAPADGGGVFNAWFSPFVLELPVQGHQIHRQAHAGTDLLEGSPGINPRNRLLRLLEDHARRFVIPVFDREVDLRDAFLRKWWRNVRPRDVREWTVLERLIFQPEERRTANREFPEGEPWHAFLVLDALNGSFLVRDFGGGAPKYLWVPPPEMSSNAHWFADYWIERWGGRMATPDDLKCLRSEPLAPPPLPAAAASGVGGIGRGPRDFQDLAELARDHPHWRASPTLAALTSVVEDAFDPSIAEGLGANGREDPLREMHRGSFRAGARGGWVFDGSFFLKQEGHRFLPASVLCVEMVMPSRPTGIPGPPVGRRWLVDLVDSSAGGIGGFIDRVLRKYPVEKSPQVDLADAVARGDDWCNGWRDAVFRHVANVRIVDTGDGSGFTLGEHGSELGGNDELGGIAGHAGRGRREPAFYT